MGSRREAESVIRKIRKSRHANDPKGAAGDANARSLARALDMLSTQLYTKSTHFILELIQNADDNTYAADVDPQLTLVYREDGYLWVGCNEVGFSKANVEAICDVNDSTKKVKNAAKGYIGEKGIGFKSVFKVADVVWVSSNHFTFRFERDQTLGMIIPVWCDFNSTKVVSERTMFCLRIPNKSDRDTVKLDLLNLRCELLLFLRKLKKIEVRIYDNDSAKPSRGVSLSCKQSGTASEHTIAILTRKNLTGAAEEHVEELFIVRNVLRGMPVEAKRERISDTEIVLAFPTSSSMQTNSPRPVYNFLPIRTYGFSFLLQADFILTASRETIEHDNAWNQALLNGARDLFVSAVRRFNHTGICKYTWPNFIACEDAAHGTIMEGFITMLRKTLQNETVLESQAGYLSQPSELMLVPHHFTDGAEPARPLFDDILNTYKYASSRYPTAHLKLLGIDYQSPQQIFALLRWMSSEQLEQKSLQWHSRLASGIVETDFSAFSSAKLIPLRSGEWISSLDVPFYLPSVDDDVDIPDGIEVRIISKAAFDDPARRKLFTLLGAEPLTTGQVCSLILDRHKFLSSSNDPLSVECLVSHAWYLFSHGSIGLNYGVLYLANGIGQAMPGRDLYVQLSNCDFPMKDYFPNNSFASIFLHDDFATRPQEVDRFHWFKWLSDTAHVSTLPNFSSGRNGNRTPEFQHLITNHPSRVWLTLIRDNWQFYSMDSTMHSTSIGAIMVDCTNGTKCHFKDAYLKTTAISNEPQAVQHVLLIDVPDPEDGRWLNLEMLGLRTRPDLHLFLSMLRSFAKQRPSTIDKDTILHVYKGIEKYGRHDPEVTRSAFAEERLVHPGVRSPSSSWRTLSECRWGSPTSLEFILPLSDEFGSCKALFVELLGVKDAHAGDVLKELCNQPSPPSISRDTIKALLVALSQYDLSAVHLEDDFKRLTQMELVPIRNNSAGMKLSAFVDADWYVADRARYAKCFDGKLSLLDVEDQYLPSITTLFERMGLTSRSLSHHVVEETVAQGEHEAQSQTTKYLRAKAPYISRLGLTASDRDTILQQITKIEVFSATTLVLRRHVRVQGQEIFGDDESGRTVLQSGSSGLRVYFSAGCISSGELPWHFVGENLISSLDLPSDRQTLLNSILYTRDEMLIEDFLERAGAMA